MAIAFLNFGSFLFISKKDLVLENIPSAPITKSTRSFVLSSNFIKTLPFSSVTSLIFFPNLKCWVYTSSFKNSINVDLFKVVYFFSSVLNCVRSNSQIFLF